MSYYRINPTRGFENLFEQIQNIANEFSKDVKVEPTTFKPRIDIVESDKKFTIYAELAGISKENVNISINEDRVLTIKGAKVKEAHSELSYLRSERKYGDFTRSLQLPEEADIDNIKANFNNGVLELNIQKKEPELAKEIEIKLS